MELSVEEIGAIRWYRSLNQRMRKAVDLWLLTGEGSLLLYEFTRPLQAAA